MTDLDPLESVAASELVSSSLLASLIPALVNRGVLTQQDATEIYENALMLLEMHRVPILLRNVSTKQLGS